MTKFETLVANELVAMGYRKADAEVYAKNGAVIEDRESFIANFVGCGCGTAEEAVEELEMGLQHGDIEETTKGEFVVFCG